MLSKVIAISLLLAVCVSAEEAKQSCKSNAECGPKKFCMKIDAKEGGVHQCHPCAECHAKEDSVDGVCPPDCAAEAKASKQRLLEDHKKEQEESVPVVPSPCIKSTDCNKPADIPQFCMKATDGKNVCNSCAECHHDADAVEGKCPAHCAGSQKEAKRKLEEVQRDEEFKKIEEENKRIAAGDIRPEDIATAVKAFEALRKCTSHEACPTGEFCHAIAKPSKAGVREILGHGCAKCGQCQTEVDGFGKACFSKCGFKDSGPAIGCVTHTDCGHDWFCSKNVPEELEKQNKFRCSPCQECHQHSDSAIGDCPSHCKYAFRGEEL